ncbi:MAG: tRNA 2-thiouridine synthesizing protein B [Alteromonadaceae bacterium]|jgi:tRNA 2-thiouridine synthesizing protein B
MTILHLVRSSAFSNDDLAQCINNVAHNDEIVLLDDGCYNLKHSLLLALIEHQPMINIHIIKEHAQARALNTNELPLAQRLHCITMTDLVSLTFSSDSVVTWQ